MSARTDAAALQRRAGGDPRRSPGRPRPAPKASAASRSITPKQNGRCRLVASRRGPTPDAEESEPALEVAPRIADAVQANRMWTVWRAVVMRWAYRLALLLMRGWWVIARPRSSGVRCLLHRGDAILLVRHSYGDRRWMLPGGRMRRAEAPVVTARREMRQELGIDAGLWTVIGCLGARAGYLRRSRAEGFRRHSTYYVATELSTIAVNPRAAEIADARWFRCGSLPDERSEALDAAVALGWLQARAGADRGEGPLEEPGHKPEAPAAR